MILLTGATGFLGMEVLVRLLEQTERDVLCLVRAPDQAAADARLAGVLETLYREPARFAGRVRALPGDLTGEVAAPDGPLDLVCHCAASISFDLSLEDAREVNVEGTRRMLDLARDGGARRFVHVSTAYVAGTRPGVFREDMLDEGQGFRNTYEQTKWEAEHLLAERAGDFGSLAVARPSIVMGESDSGWTPAFNVLYWPLRAFARGLFDQVPARPDGRVDVVPVDYVADGIAQLVASGDSGTFNLVSGEEAATVDQLSALACTHFDRPKPPYVQPGAFGDAAADEHGAVYLPYFDMSVVFDDTRARTELGLRPPPLSSYFDALMDYADLARWGKSALSREEARERGALARS